MIGWDNSVILGNIGEYKFGKTNTHNEDACTFTMHIHKRGGHTTKVRVNMYGTNNVQLCRRKIDRGSPVLVHGELMVRRCKKLDDDVVEIRGHSIEFLSINNREEKDEQCRA